MENKELYNVIISDNLTWEGLIRDIVRDEEMNPWDINITQLSVRFASEIKKMKNVDFRMSGKFILTASILLKMKSDLLLANDKQEQLNDSVSLAWLFKDINYNLGPAELIPRIPMKKKRRVSLEELINALNKALEVNERRFIRRKETAESRAIKLDIKKIDLKEKIAVVYSTITDFFKKLKKKEVNFKELLPSKQRFDVVWTFIPLLYLNNKGKVVLSQEKTFGDIIVRKP